MLSAGTKIKNQTVLLGKHTLKGKNIRVVSPSFYYRHKPLNQQVIKTKYGKINIGRLGRKTPGIVRWNRAEWLVIRIQNGLWQKVKFLDFYKAKARDTVRNLDYSW